VSRLCRGRSLLPFLAALSLLMSACALVSTTPTAPTPSPTPTPTLALPTLDLAPTATPLPSQCVSTTGVSAGTFPDVPVPDDAIMFDEGYGGTGGVTATPVTFQKTGVCTKALTPDAVRAFYAARMPANGWTHSATFPANGDLNAPCPDAYCWRKTPAPNVVRTVALENVRVIGGITVYTIDDITYG
jgi:hypothetical protein